MNINVEVLPHPYIELIKPPNVVPLDGPGITNVYPLDPTLELCELIVVVFNAVAVAAFPEHATAVVAVAAFPEHAPAVVAEEAFPLRAPVNVCAVTVLPVAVISPFAVIDPPNTPLPALLNPPELLNPAQVKLLKAALDPYTFEE